LTRSYSIITVAYSFSVIGEMFSLNSCRPEPFSVDTPKDHCDCSVDVGEAVIGKYGNEQLHMCIPCYVQNESVC
jgi:hypothetical protein